MKDPLIFDIKRASTSDGPGLRTVVFFKGCSLDCAWCHNPEGKMAEAELAIFSEKCVFCGACQSTCARGTDACRLCGACVATCPANARKLYGRAYSVEALTERLLSDRAYYAATGGGVTFSGGECMLYPEYLSAVAKRCRESRVSVAVDTAGQVPYASFETVLPYVDVFLYDIKCMDPALHMRGTGAENGQILENLDRLLKTGKQIIVRTPVIPDFNDGEELEKIQAYCRERDLPLELLPYHAFGEDKRRALQ
ncbi:MAG: glycyl-radical enzyme activating protein [Clostridia bacterium]|nr:glycyl-radical enzyme activating protein [Clostridia bacterium]